MSNSKGEKEGGLHTPWRVSSASVPADNRLRDHHAWVIHRLWFHCLFSTVAKSVGTLHSLLPHWLQWNEVKLVWQQLQLRFLHASFNGFKYTVHLARSPLLHGIGAPNLHHTFGLSERVVCNLHTQVLLEDSAPCLRKCCNIAFLGCSLAMCFFFFWDVNCLGVSKCKHTGE